MSVAKTVARGKVLWPELVGISGPRLDYKKAARVTNAAQVDEFSQDLLGSFAPPLSQLLSDISPDIL